MSAEAGRSEQPHSGPQTFPSRVVTPSRAMIETTISADTGSARHQPRTVFGKPPKQMGHAFVTGDGWRHAIVCVPAVQAGLMRGTWNRKEGGQISRPSLHLTKPEARNDVARLAVVEPAAGR